MSTRPAKPPVNILVVEDSPTQAQQLRHILDQHGYDVGVAANGRLALEMAAQLSPALIISDVVMPEMDGYDLSRRIKADPKLANIPIILVTTMSDPQDVIRGLECGADNFVVKPYDERYLLDCVQYALVNRAMRRAEDVGMGVTIYFNGQRHLITADRLQILNLLLSTYEAAIQRNKELICTKTELEAANRELESFSYSVSHDLRAPLRHINGYVEMLLKDTRGQLTEEPQRYLNVIADASQQMSDLIDDLLEFSRMGRTELRESPVDLNDLVREAIAHLETEIRDRRVTWTIPRLPWVKADPAMLMQVFSNLLGNAVKYTRPRDVAAIEIGCGGEEEGRLILFVRDNGVGFDMNYADKLFGVFQRLHRADQFEGTGIGLANVRRIIARHGGRTWAEGKIDEGATIYFTLRPSKSLRRP